MNRVRSAARAMAVAAVALLLLVGCTGSAGSDAAPADGDATTTTTSPPATDVDGNVIGADADGPYGVWLVSDILLDQILTTPPAETAGRVEIGADSITGDTGCNAFGLTATFSDDGTIEAGLSEGEQEACESDPDDFDGNVIEAFNHIERWNLDGDLLVLSGERVEIVLRPGE